MTVLEAIEKVDYLRPNSFSNEQKLHWLNEVEQLLIGELYSKYKSIKPCELNMQSNLIVSIPYSKIYLIYMLCQMDFYNDDISRYNNSAAMFNNAYMQLQTRIVQSKGEA